MAEKRAKKPTDPKKWALAKRKARATSEGSEPGKWSARKAAIAQRQYEKWGGKWTEGPTIPAPNAKAAR